MKKKYNFKIVILFLKLKIKLGKEWPSHILHDECYFEDMKELITSNNINKKLFLHLIRILARSTYIIKKDYPNLFIFLYKKYKDNPDKKIIYEIIESMGKIGDLNGVQTPKFKTVLLDSLSKFKGQKDIIDVTIYAIICSEISGAYSIIKNYKNNEYNQKLIQKSLNDWYSKFPKNHRVFDKVSLGEKNEK
jgi:hypothetical protein